MKTLIVLLALLSQACGASMLPTIAKVTDLLLPIAADALAQEWTDRGESVDANEAACFPLPEDSTPDDNRIYLICSAPYREDDPDADKVSAND